jgi:hypothetical protein
MTIRIYFDSGGVVMDTYKAEDNVRQLMYSAGAKDAYALVYVWVRQKEINLSEFIALIQYIQSYN